MDLVCKDDARREDVRRNATLNGIDYVEVTDNPPTLYVYFLGKLPPQLSKGGANLVSYLSISGGQGITGLKIIEVDPEADPDPERDDYLLVKLDRAGDFSTYTLQLVGVDNIDPVFASATFSFKIDCPSDLDCKAPCDCPPPVTPEPHLDYLAKDYASFRQLLLDRMSLLMPGWTERHVPDIGVTLVEMLAYVGDYLSYYQDAVATEAYLETARQRISVRRHARLIDYRLHDGCNARAWLAIETSQDIQFNAGDIAFVTGNNAALAGKPSILIPGDLTGVPSSVYEYFEPMLTATTVVNWLKAHNEIHLYSWGRRECCLPVGSRRATLLDQWVGAPADARAAGPATAAPPAGVANRPPRALQLAVGSVIVFEEVFGPHTGVPADADPKHRHVVRITKVTPTEDPLYSVQVGPDGAQQSLPTPLLEIEWAGADALPFPVCVSVLGPTPDCKFLPYVTVVRGNVVLVDHGRSLPPETYGPVPPMEGESCCECEGEPVDVPVTPGRFTPELANSPLTFRVPVTKAPHSATAALQQDARVAVPQITLTDSSSASWNVQQDLIESREGDRDFVVEVDNDAVAHLRFGDGELGRQPDIGSTFTASYRVGNGAVGNVGAESISHLLLKTTRLDGVVITVRNPLPAEGGTDPEPTAEAKLYAPATFRKQLERAITADDYATIAARNPALQRASAVLAWTGSWYEADVSVDPLHVESASDRLLDHVDHYLHKFRRMGHDLKVLQAVYVPIALTIDVCALPGYDRGHVEAALLQVLGNGRLPSGALGFFNPDNLSFGDDVKISRIVAAAQAVRGVACVEVVELRRQFEPPNGELQSGVLPLKSNEIAQLDNDPNHPERGYVQINVAGGRA